MRLHNNNENFPIITDTDIIMTDNNAGQNIGKTLHDVLDEHDNKIERLESNMKWMYRYGALGSGGTGGEGGGTTSKITVFIYKDGIQPVSPGTKLMYAGPGNYKFKVELHGGGSDTFLVKFFYNKGVTQSKVLSKDNEFSTDVTLKLEGNEELTITIKNQSTGEFYMVNNDANLRYPYITSAYNLTAYYVSGSDINATNLPRYNVNNNIIFMSSVATKGLMIALNYNIAVEIQKNLTRIEYEDWENKRIVIDNEGLHKYDLNGTETLVEYNFNIDSNSSGVMYLPLADNIIEFLNDNTNAAFKQVTVSVYSQLKDVASNESILFGTFNFFDNLLPNGLFLNVKTLVGKLYTSYSTAALAQTNNQITNGDIIFKVTPFNGSLDPTRHYELKINIFDVDENGNETLNELSPINTFGLRDQSEESIVLAISSVGVKKISFDLTDMSSSDNIKTSYYVNIKTFNSSYDWYPIGVEPATSTQSDEKLSCIFKRNEGVENISTEDSFVLSQGSNIQMTSNDTKRTINLDYDEIPNGLNAYDLLFGLGIQYSSVNDTEVPILSLNVKNSTNTNKRQNTIFIYQNKIAIANADVNVSNVENISFKASYSVDIFIPFENDYLPSQTLNEDESDPTNQSSKYHLFNIYKRYEGKDLTNNNMRSFSSYIDGTLEGLINSFLTADTYYDSITLYPGNYSINLLEVSLFLHSKHKSELDTSSDESVTWLEDIDINRYFKSYIEKIIYRSDFYDDNNKMLFEYFSHFTYDDDNRVIVNENDIHSIASIAECPVMLMSFVDTGQIKNFTNWFENTYGENDETGNIPVTIKYSSGKEELKDIKLPDEDNKIATFYAEIQGSSTKSYRVKNLELYAPSPTDDYDYLYTPNLCKDKTDPNYSSSFLPEGSFTLKADVVDSSHTNNNAIGKFVNDNTTKFRDAANNINQTARKYKENIKNTLIGFPILLFIKTSDTSETDGLCYFLGIYNFNLGRKSYYNLGYKNIANIEGLMDAVGAPESGFAIYKIQSNQNVQIDNMSGGEIQGNNAHFDFSQYSQTVLFDDELGMWGDYIGTRPTNTIQSELQTLCQDVSFAGGFIFTQLGKQMSEDPSERYGYANLYSKITEQQQEDGSTKIIEWVPNYHWQAEIEKIDTQIFYNYTHITNNIGEPLDGLLIDLKNLIIEYEDNGETHLPRVDFVSLAEYYTTMMAMGLVDSPMKNLNMKSWNNGNTYYAAFYDMDTGLGKNNAGTYINYFAFSDYWKSVWTKQKNSDVGDLNQVKVIRDYSPEYTEGENKGSYFDVPSSYLFAVAKYASSILGINSENTEIISNNDPTNIWAKWRKTNGCLRNAKYFMKTYFNHHLDNIPDEAFNFNYRYKYLVKDQNKTNFDSTNFIKFHGKGQAYTEYWLDGRLHILDAYFNLSSITDVITKINGVDLYAPKPNEAHISELQANPDVYILQDAFSGNSAGLQYPTAQANLVIEAKAYAPLVIKYPQYKERYLFPANGEKSEITFQTTGNQIGVFGGSNLWTSISSIVPFITQTNTFSIYSKYISSLVGKSGTCKSWILNTPSLRTLILSPDTEDGANYSGHIEFDATYQNIDEIDISRTSISVTLTGVPIRKLYATNMKEGSEIDLMKCDKLEDVRISGVFNHLALNSWSNDISLPSGGSTLSCREINITNDVERFPDATINILRNEELREITISGFAHVKISGCPKLETIKFMNPEIVKTLDIQMSQFSTEEGYSFKIRSNEDNVVNLSEFYNLSALRLSNTTVETIILPTSPVDPDTGNMTYVEEPRKIMLLDNAFSGCLNLMGFENEEDAHTDLEVSYKYTNKLYITGQRTFFNCRNYCLKQLTRDNGELIYDNKMSNIYIDSECLTLKDTFNGCGGIEYTEASKFLTERCTLDTVENVTSIENMFRGNSIVYDYFGESGVSACTEYRNKECSLPLYNFVNCTNAKHVFSDNNVNFFNRYMFEKTDVNNGYLALFRESELLSLVTMCNGFMYGTEDMLYPFINKTLTIDFSGTTNSIIIYNPNVNISQPQYNSSAPFNLNTLFCNPQSGIRPTNIISISNFTISPTKKIQGNGWSNQWFSFEGFLDNNLIVNESTTDNDYNWLAAHKTGISFNRFMNGIYHVSRRTFNDQIQGSMSESYVNKLFAVTVPVEIIKSFDGFYSVINGDLPNVYTMFNWAQLSGRTTKLFSDAYNGTNVLSYGGFDCEKTCDYDNFQEIWSYLLSSQTLLAISSIFTNCTIQKNNWDNIEFELTNSDITNTSITTVPKLFNNLKLIDNDGIEKPINITSKLFRKIKNLTFVSSIFESTYMKHAIPFDIFGKRKRGNDKVMSGIYVKVGENDYRTAKIATYDYNNTISNMINAFYDVTFETKELATFRNTGAHNYNLFEKDYAYDSNNEETSEKYFEYYKLNNGEYVRYDVEQPLEIQDIEKLYSDNPTELYKTNSISEMVNDYKLPNVYKSTYSNRVYDYSIHGYYENLTNFCSDGFVVSPDIFRCCNRNCNITSALAYNRTSTNNDPIIMTGMMPPSIFKTDYLRKINFSGVFTGLNVTPIEICYYDEDTITVGTSQNNTASCTRKNTYYQYILDNFTENDVLDSCFNFMILLPKSTSPEVYSSDYTYEEERHSQHFIMFSENSLPKNLRSMTGALPKDFECNVLEDNDASHMHNYYVRDNGIYFNIMLSFKNIKTGDNPETYEAMKVTGIDSSYFFNFKYDSLINGDIAKIYNGYIISEKNIWNTQRTNGGTMINDIHTTNSPWYGLSANAKIQAQAKNYNMFPRSGGGYNINKQSLYNPIEPSSEYWFNYNFVDYVYNFISEQIVY